MRLSHDALVESRLFSWIPPSYQDADRDMGHKPRRKRKQQKIDKTTPSASPIVSAADPQKTVTPDSPADQSSKEENVPQRSALKPPHRDEWVFVFTAAIAFSTIIYTAFAGYQLRIMGGQLDEARKALPRPWVGLADNASAMNAGFVAIGESGNATTSCSVLMKNYGNYPAQDVWVSVELMLSQDYGAVLARSRDIVREGSARRAGTTLWPGQTMSGWDFVVSPSGPTVRPSVLNPDPLRVYVVGCIFYCDQFNDLHYTGFIYRYRTLGTNRDVTTDLSPETAIPGQWVACGGFVK